jgi:hypothetical protein
MPPPWQTPIRLRVNLQSFETRCRVRRWIIQEADMLPGTAQRAYIVQAGRKVVLSSRAQPASKVPNC